MPSLRVHNHRLAPLLLAIVAASFVAGYIASQISAFPPSTAVLIATGFLFLVFVLSLRLLGRRGVAKGLDILAPGISFPLIYTVYFGFGSLNISSLRGYIPPWIYSYYILGLCGYFAGIGTAYVVSKLRRSTNFQVEKRDATRFVDIWSKNRVQKGVHLLLIIGTLSVCLALYLYGVPLLGTYIRFNVSGYIAYLVSFLWIGAYLSYFHSMSTRGRPTLRNFLLILYVFIALMMFGYRTPIMMCFMNIIFSTYYLKSFRLGKKKLFWLGLGGSLMILFGSGFWYLRYDILGEGMGAAHVIESVGYPRQFSFFFPLYSALRASVSVFYKFLLIIPRHYDFFGGKLFMTEFVAILPGKQLTGGTIVSYMVGGTGRAGLTTSILGGLYADFGKAGIFAGLFLLGFGARWFYNRMRVKATKLNLLLYCYFLSFAIHYLHRGLFKPAYVMHFVILLLFGRLVERAAPWQAKGKQEDASSNPLA